jgi:hypothetical protein
MSPPIREATQLFSKFLLDRDDVVAILEMTRADATTGLTVVLMQLLKQSLYNTLPSGAAFLSLC